jgi:hypothetical protein
MIHKTRLIVCSALLGLSGLGAGVQALEIAERGWLTVQGQGNRRTLGVAPGVPRESGPELPETPRVLVDTRLSRLVVRDKAGRELAAPQRELVRGRTGRRVALELRPEWLRAGVEVVEDGPPIEVPVSRDASGESPWAPHHLLRITVDQAGMHALTTGQLRESLGPAGLAGLPDPRLCTLVHKGQAVPVRITGEDDGRWDEGDRLEFLAELGLPDDPDLGPDSRLNPYSDSEVYFLASNGSPGLRLGQESGEIVETDPSLYSTPLSFYHREHFEQDQFHSQLGFVENEPQPDHFFWETNLRAGQLRNFPFRTPGLNNRSSQPVKLTLCLRGGSAPPDEGDPYRQRVQAWINGSSSQALDIGADGNWLNQELRLDTFGAEAFPSHTGFNQDNTLTIAGMDLAPAGPFSNAMLNWFDVEYQRLYRAEDDRLYFSADGEYAGNLVYFNLTGFTTDDVLVYKLGRTRITNLLVRPDAGGYRVAFQDVPAPGDRYLAIAAGGLRAPVRVDPVEYHNLADPGVPSGFLVVMADSLYRSGGEQAVEDLLPLWGREGSVRIVSDAWVYDEFGDGRFSPFALRSFLDHLQQRAIEAPGHVLLLGDGALEQRPARREGLPLLPVRFEQVYRWGAASTDEWFVAGEQGVSDGPLLTRWPVNSPEQLANMVRKRLAYEQAPTGEWNNSVYLIAASRPSEGDIFIEQREQLVRQNVPQGYFLRRLDVGFADSRYDGLTAELVRQFDRGAALVNYFGHGGGAVWYDFNLLRSEDVPGLGNAQRLPLVTNTTCHIASIELEDALGKSLLNSGPMGAIGVLGASGVSFFQASMELMQLYYDFQLSNPGLEVSRALRLAEDQFRIDRVYSGGSELDARIATTVIILTQLLGDPAQRLRLPGPTGVDLAAGSSVRAGDPLVFSGQSGLPGAEGRLEVYSMEDHPELSGPDFVDAVVAHAFTADGDGAWQVQLSAPDSLYPAGLWAGARVLLHDGERALNGHQRFFYGDSLQQVWMSDAALVPEFPQAGESIALWLTAAAPGPIDSVTVAIRAHAANGDSLDLGRRLWPLAGQPTRFSSQQDIGPFANGTRLRMLYFVHSQGSVSTSNPTWFEVDRRRPQIVSDWLGYGAEMAGTARLRLRNTGRGVLDSLQVSLRDSLGTSLQTWRLPGLDPGAERMQDLALASGHLGQLVTLVVDPTGQAGDSLLAGRWPFRLDTVFLVEGGPDPVLRREVLPGVVIEGLAAGSAQSAVPIQVSRVPVSQQALRQPDLQTGLPLLSVRPLDPTESLRECRLEWSAWGADTLGLRTLQPFVIDSLTWAAVYQQSPPLQVEPLAGGLRAHVVFRGAGVTLARLSDSEAPQAEVAVRDQVFAHGDHVPAQPVFSWSITDRNGLASSSLELALDGQAVDEDERTVQATGEAGGLLVQYTPDFRDDPAAAHALSLTVRDAAGNPRLLETAFRVTADFQLAYLGNYPNPFDRETRFIYSLSGIADRVEVRIYTVAGRRIRTLHKAGPVINYDEIFWDGRDEVGEPVANGVYFYRFIARGEGGEISRQGKMARIKR